MNLADLEGIGPVRLETLRAVGIFSLRDLLFTLPIRYEDHNTVYACNVKTTGEVLVSGMFPTFTACQECRERFGMDPEGCLYAGIMNRGSANRFNREILSVCMED